MIQINNTTLKICVLCSIVGSIGVTLGNTFVANLIWSISNPIMVIHNHNCKQKEQAILFSIFTLLAWVGLLRELLM